MDNIYIVRKPLSDTIIEADPISAFSDAGKARSRWRQDFPSRLSCLFALLKPFVYVLSVSDHVALWWLESSLVIAKEAEAKLDESITRCDASSLATSSLFGDFNLMSFHV
ncbi:hypothetical protein F2Q69_00023529 [Brassica cretica]|uniref:Uncharacterized protein n=1 Tax=Brassica cretica TaxID=69181 RepID=A0A8S9PZ31_BRACR|nr:hypothetical protein F2Q69_00023529 [Brassica cretica]